MSGDIETIISKLTAASEAYERVINMPGNPSTNVLAIAAAMVLTMHGHLFAEAAAALKGQP